MPASSAGAVAPASAEEIAAPPPLPSPACPPEAADPVEPHPADPADASVFARLMQRDEGVASAETLPDPPPVEAALNPGPTAMPAPGPEAMPEPRLAAVPEPASLEPEAPEPVAPPMIVASIGPGMRQRLQQLGYRTDAQLAAADPAALRHGLGEISRLLNIEAWIADARRNLGAGRGG
jgi:hypothetical protein